MPGNADRRPRRVPPILWLILLVSLLSILQSLNYFGEDGLMGFVWVSTTSARIRAAKAVAPEMLQAPENWAAAPSRSRGTNSDKKSIAKPPSVATAAPPNFSPEVQTTPVPAPKTALALEALPALEQEVATKHRSDFKCGKMVQLLPGRVPVPCDSAGENPCCSSIGWCGSKPGHCDCQGCVDYRAPAELLAQRVAADPADIMIQDRLALEKRLNPTTGATVAVIVPFRDREGHLVLFKKFWRDFALTGVTPRTVKNWEIYIAEQFDPTTFNRGWNFNVGLAVATAQTKASGDITDDMRLKHMDCAVIQDIDYLPEKGVDYSQCSMPTQLSAEIDRYNWKTPYLESAGGIVSMNFEHWRKINGFSNEYFGWGGEDDELHHRLRLNHLLGGDCYPFCSIHDPRIGRTGLSIKRPPKGHGRFSGEYMHSANHTKRITDKAAYDKNLALLKEISHNSDRWRRDGLSNLAFRIIDYSVDSSDTAEFGITYHHVKFHRGGDAYNVWDIVLAAPVSLCSSSAPSVANSWAVEKLGKPLPLDPNALRRRVASMLIAHVDSANSECSSVSSISFILIDLRLNVAKILSDDDPTLLKIFYRSLHDPTNDGLIIADSRPKPMLVKAFVDAGILFAPPAWHSICTSPLRRNGPKYSVHTKAQCNNGGWERVDGGFFRAYLSPREGMRAVSHCDNEKYWTQRVISEASCDVNQEWAGLKWSLGGTFWVPPGSDFCVGSRQDQAEASFSRMLPRSNCAGDGFSHDFTFGRLKEEIRASTVSVCIGTKGKRFSEMNLRVSTKGDCHANGHTNLITFPARRVAAKDVTSTAAFCALSTGLSDAIMHAGECGSKQTFSFILPDYLASPTVLSADAVATSASRRKTVCISSHGNNWAAALGDECEKGTWSLSFKAPSVLDLIASTPQGPGGGGDTPVPLYSLVEEEVDCPSFVCPELAKQLW